MTRLVGDRVTLRAYRDDEASILVSTWADAEWFAPRGTGPRELKERVRERIRRSGGFTEGVVILAIEAEGRAWRVTMTHRVATVRLRRRAGSSARSRRASP